MWYATMGSDGYPDVEQLEFYESDTPGMYLCVSPDSTHGDNPFFLDYLSDSPEAARRKCVELRLRMAESEALQVELERATLAELAMQYQAKLAHLRSLLQQYKQEEG